MCPLVQLPALVRQTDGQTDGFVITISRPACIACWIADSR